MVNFCLILFFCLHLRTVFASEFKANNVYTLKGSIALALEKNWSLKALEEKKIQAMGVKNQSRADLLPKLEMDYGYTRMGSISNLESKDNFQWRVTVSQPLFAGFGLISAYRFAKLGIDLAQIEVELNMLDLALQVKDAYFKILTSDKTVYVIEKEVEFLSSNLEVTNNFYKAEIIPENDLLKAELELANSQQNLVAAKNQAKMARSAFNIVLAQPVNAPVDVEDILVYQPEVVEFQATVEKALKVRPEIKFIDTKIQQAEQQLKLIKSRFYPEISLNYNYIKEGDEADVSGSPFHDENRWQVAAMCSWSLWESGKTHYAVKERQSIINELAKTRKAIEENIYLDIKEATLGLDTAENNIPTTQKAVLQGEENLRVNEVNYQAQMNTITDILDAQSLLTQARVNYYKALYGHNLAMANLLRAMGTY